MSEGHETTNETKYLQIQLEDSESEMHGSRLCAFMDPHVSLSHGHFGCKATRVSILIPTHPHLLLVLVRFWVSAIPVVFMSASVAPRMCKSVFFVSQLSPVELNPVEFTQSELDSCS